MSIEIEQLRKYLSDESLFITKHMRMRCKEREISIDDIFECVQSGTIIKQYEDDKPFPSCLINGFSAKNIPLHIVVSLNNSIIYLITAYFPEVEKWNKDFSKKLQEV